MCYNKETSLAAFISSFIVSGLLFSRNKPNDKFMAFFILTISSMQLVEFFIWKNINNKELNKFYTRIAHILAKLHPICALFVLYKFGNLIIPNSYLIYPLIISLIYTVYLLYELFM